MKAFEGIGSKTQRALQMFKKKLHRGEVEAKDEAKEVAEQLEIWNFTSFSKLPEEVRRRIIKDLQYRYKEICVIRPRLALLAHDRAKLHRLQEARQAEVTKALNRALNFRKFCALALVTNAEGLTALTADHEGNVKAYAEALRDQIRARIHAHGVPGKDLPAIKSGHGQPELTRLEDGLRALFASAIPGVLPRVAPYPIRPAPAGYQSTEALAADLEHMKAIQRAWIELSAMTELGVFKANRSTSKKQSRRNPSAKVTSARQPPAKRAAPSKPKRAITASESDLVGEAFEEDGVDWMVLSVEWSAIHQRVMVWYFDVDTAEAENLTKEMMLAARAADEDFDAIECSTVAEIRAWIASS